MSLRFLVVFCLLPLVFLSACTKQEQAPVELKGDKFYGFDSASAEDGSTIHIVQPRESLSLLAKRYHVSSRSIALANQLPAPYVIKVGQKLRIPTTTQPLNRARSLAKLDHNTYDAVPVSTIKSSTIAPAPQQEQQIIVVKKVPLLITPPQSAETTGNQPKAPLQPIAKTASAPAIITPPMAVKPDSQFSWPLKGSLLLHFGPGKGGYFNDGINISAPEDTPIAASAAGKVVYAGNELRGYGNLVIIRHDNGWLTAYAHQKTMMVKKGDNVTKGQIIGHVGATGNVAAPQLHFGIRNGKNALNPEEYLPKG